MDISVGANVLQRWQTFQIARTALPLLAFYFLQRLFVQPTPA